MRKRFWSRKGTDDPRPEPSEGPGAAKEEPRPSAEKPARKSRRSPRKANDHPAQGKLFDDAAPPEAEPSPEAASSEAKKSRSKRRRERRKAAKADREDTRDSGALRATRPATHAAAKGPKQRPSGPEAKPGSPAKGGAKSRGPRNEAPARGPAARGQARERQAAHGSDARKRGRPQGLPPMTREDMEAVASGIGDGAIPRHVSNLRGQARQAAAPTPDSVRRLETLSSSTESLTALAALEAVLDEAAPLQAKHRAALKGDIRRLWEELTSEKESRAAEYLGSPPALSAYLRYFLPWNVFRLTSLLTNADFCLPDNAVVADLGSGPLTLPIALWIARPELRDVPLTIYCMDRVERVLEAGITVFQTLCMRVAGRLPPWRIEPRKDSFGSPLPERAHLLTAANVLNEFFWKDRRNLGEKALDAARTLLSYIRENGSVFIMEPGDPRSGALVSALRAALLSEGAAPLGPCPHSYSCPMPGIFRHLLPPEETRTATNDPNAAPSRFVLPPVNMPKKRDKFPWCHFGVDALKAPAWLEALSEEAGLPKERAVLSYLWAARGAMSRPPAGLPEPGRGNSDRERRAKAGRGILVRVVSDRFALPDGSSGQYACSSLGYTLLRRKRGDPPFGSGDLLEVTSSGPQRTDDKSGAIILPT